MERQSQTTKVIVRSRPLPPETNQTALTFDGDQIILAGGKGFEFDKILTECQSQSEVFDAVRGLVDHFWEGYNGTILAYGQTGTGKTYTMGMHADMTNNDIGLVPRMIEAIFLKFDNVCNTFYDLTISFIEIYNEEVYDLLAPVPSKLQLRGLTVDKATRLSVLNTADALSKLAEGLNCRRQCSTQGNTRSSRSHALFSIYLNRPQGDGETLSALHMVDLAGSECAGKAGNQGINFQEGVNINKGLLALGNVVDALAKQKMHIPFRDSTLTSVLQSSLDHKSYLTIIGCISPRETDLAITINTLNFVQRAHKITNRPQIEKMVAETKDKVRELRTPGWKSLQKASVHSVKGTPGSKIRRPLAVYNSTLPTPITPNLFDETNQSYLTVKSTRTHSPTFSLPNLSLFEPERCSSALSFVSAKDDKELSVLMNSIISVRLEEERTELRRQTEALVELKVAESLRAMSQVQPLNSQLASVLGSTSQNATEPKLYLEDKENKSLAKNLFGNPESKSTPTLRRSARQSIKASPENASKVEQSDEKADTTLINTVVESTLVDEDKTPQPQPPQRRRSLRIGVLEQSLLNNTSDAAPAAKKRRSSLSLKAFRGPPSQASISQQTSPSLESMLLEMGPRLSRSRRSSVLPQTQWGEAAPSVVFADDTPERNPKLAARSALKKRRQSLTAPVNQSIISKSLRRRTMVSPLEEMMEEVPSPSTGKAQKTHNKVILQFLNEQSLKGLQQLPTVGPKTAFVIFSHRKLNGPFKRITDLSQVAGLPKTFLKRFTQANNIDL